MLKKKEEDKTRTMLSFDYAIKKPLRLKSNLTILEGFLSELLESDIRVMDIIEGYSNPDDFNNDQPGITLIAKDAKNDALLVELQYRTELDYPLRMLYDLGNKTMDYQKSGEPYGRMKKAFSIAFVFFNDEDLEGDDPEVNDEYVYHGKQQFTGMSTGEEISLTDRQKRIFEIDPFGNLFHEYYVIITDNFHNAIRNTLDEWIYYLKNGEIKDGFTAKGMKELRNLLDIEKLSPEEKLQYESEFDSRFHNKPTENKPTE